ncbi:hypothetical protein RvY_02378 [Ramazzottius varieornatus]|uniref:Uncharacterized protein n=1 Tax=Ramazzottius varieornatus TaxID=947166 RepID=A0A1D1UJI9_RAMVA|nr:hypothetical protein RvY_02378 [Ramazzottius varieornatus]
MSGQSKQVDGGSATKRRKAGGSSFPFHSLVDILEPDGPSTPSSWKSVVDREDHLVVFFQVDYRHVVPRLAKCIRIQREKVTTLEPERLVPSVYFGRHLDHSFVKKTLGHRYLRGIDDLQILLDRVDSVNRKDIAKIFSEDAPEAFPRTIVSKRKKYTVDLPSTEDEEEEATDEGEAAEGVQSLDKNGADYGNPELVTIFNSLLAGDQKPCPGPVLECQVPGPGKIPLSEEDYRGKNLYFGEEQLRLLQCDWKGRPQTYLIKLLDKLLGAEGLDFVRQRREDRKKAGLSTKEINPSHHSTTAKELLGEEFLRILQLHMEDNGSDLNVNKISSIIRQHWADIFRAKKSAPRPDEVSDDDEDDEDASPHKIFTFDAPRLPSENEDYVKKVSLIHTTDANFSGMQLYVDKKGLKRLRKKCGDNAKKYAVGVFDLTLGPEGIAFIREKRKDMKEAAFKEGAKRTPLFGVRKMFTSDFLDMIRVHMSQNDMTWTTAELVFRLNEHVNTLLREKKQKDPEPTTPAEAETRN